MFNKMIYISATNNNSSIINKMNQEIRSDQHPNAKDSIQN